MIWKFLVGGATSAQQRGRLQCVVVQIDRIAAPVGVSQAPRHAYSRSISSSTLRNSMRQSSRETARAERQEIMASFRLSQRHLNCATL